MAYLTGFADEAANDIEDQIKATKALGWSWIESRAVSGTNIHDLSEEDFEKTYAALDGSGIGVNCFGSAAVRVFFRAAFESAVITALYVMRLICMSFSRIFRINNY